jgi:hypothetical protein
MQMKSKLGVYVAVVALGLSVMPRGADARDPEECQLAWGQAVRSYLTQNRTKGPEDVVFAPACEIEARGEKDEARIAAAVIGARALASLDPRGCQRFMESYMSSARPKDVCDAALEPDEGRLKKLIVDSIPPRSQGTAKKKR